jgi:hypothetical protein
MIARVCMLWVMVSLSLAAGAAPADPPAEGEGQSPPQAAAGLDNSLRRLRNEAISAPRPREADAGAALGEAIRKLQAEIKRAERSRTAPPQTQSPVQPPPRKTPAQSPPTTTRPAVDAKVLARLRRKPIAGVVEPMSLADALYLAERPETAAIFYGLALQREQDKRDVAWAKVQMANCLRRTDPARARKIYKDLLSGQPDSVWSHLAAAQERLLDWYGRKKPEEFLSGLRRMRRSEADEPSAGGQAEGPSAGASTAAPETPAGNK